MGTSFIENLPKSCLLFAFLLTKLLATSTRFIAKKVSFKLQGLLKFNHFDSLATNFGLFYLTLLNLYVTLVTRWVRLIQFCSLDLFYNNGPKACSKYTVVAQLLKVLRSFTVLNYAARVKGIWVKKDIGKELGQLKCAVGQQIFEAHLPGGK